mgnify:CR=1 FL=1
MKIKETRKLSYQITLDEEELDALISTLSVAKHDWNLTDIGAELLNKLKGCKEI